MVFSSGVFLFLFLPVVILLHTFIRNNKARNGMLIAASLIFYAYGEPFYILLLLLSVFINYMFGRVLAHNKNRILFGIIIAFNLAVLIVFKYTGIAAMPIGISFFTFQAISYIVDVYRSDEDNRVGFFDVLLYISLFPQLIAGPIVKFNTIKDSIKQRQVTVDGLASGIKRFIIGLSKKMLIANTMAYAADKVFGMNTSDIGTALAWLGAVCYTLQIYFDFSGYSDMALGLGSMLGFKFPENFQKPYTAVSIRGFWRRWHMSLTAWFREYLYIPLGGSRCSKARAALNTMIVFACTGIWHGANLTFLVWGLFHGTVMCIETLIVSNKEERFNFFKWLYTMIIVITGFIIFRADNIRYGFAYIGRMFSFSPGSYRIMVSLLTPVFIATLIPALIACTHLTDYIRAKLHSRRIYKVINSLGYIMTFVLFMLCVMELAADSYNPFIYFRF